MAVVTSEGSITCNEDIVNLKDSIPDASYPFSNNNNGSMIYATAWSKTDIKVKEVVLVTLALTLLVTSLCLFYKNWKKNYRDINQLPYYSYMYKCESPPVAMTRVPTGTRVPSQAPVLHWAKAAASIGTGLAISNPSNQNGSVGMIFTHIT